MVQGGGRGETCAGLPTFWILDGLGERGRGVGRWEMGDVGLKGGGVRGERWGWE